VWGNIPFGICEKYRWFIVILFPFEGGSLYARIKMRNEIIPYNRKLKDRARELRKNSTFTEVLLWKAIKNKKLGVEFHRQVPIHNFIVDFYCHELKLAIEIDGESHNDKEEYDREREKILESFGVKFIRFSTIDIRKTMNGVLELLALRIRELHPSWDF